MGEKWRELYIDTIEFNVSESTKILPPACSGSYNNGGNNTAISEFHEDGTASKASFRLIYVLLPISFILWIGCCMVKSRMREKSGPGGSPSTPAAYTADTTPHPTPTSPVASSSTTTVVVDDDTPIITDTPINTSDIDIPHQPAYNTTVIGSTKKPVVQQSPILFQK